VQEVGVVKTKDSQLVKDSAVAVYELGRTMLEFERLVFNGAMNVKEFDAAHEGWRDEVAKSMADVTTLEYAIWIARFGDTKK
jgi:hypothetical protein